MSDLGDHQEIAVIHQGIETGVKKESFKDLFSFGPKPLSKMNQWILGS